MKRERLVTARALKSEKLRFALVGVVNTSVDFVILFVLARVMGVPVVVANMVSTIIAVGVSYVLNKKAVFKNVDKQGVALVIAFVAVTLAGLWGLQSLVIVAITALFAHTGDQAWVLLLAKVIATVASLIWNYLWYSRVIFRKSDESKI